MTGGLSLGVSLRATLHALGRTLELFGLTFAVPALVAAIYWESPLPFLIPLAIGVILGYLLERLNRGKGRLGTREAFLVVTICPLAAVLLGTAPYLLTGSGIGHWADAFMESMAALTTTNMSTVADPDQLSRPLLFWRQFSQWLGGLGAIVLALALLPRLRVGGREPETVEQPGREVEKLSRSIQIVTRRFSVVYLLLTAAAITILVAFCVFDVDDRLSLFDAVGIALSTVSTGGFSTQAGSLAELSAATRWVVLIFMTLAGANLLLVFRALVRRELRPLVRDGETHLYLAIGAIGTVGIAAALAARGGAGFWNATGDGLFHSLSFLSTTGFTSVDTAEWPLAAAAILVGLVLIGGCASSLAGSQKVMRVQIVGKLLMRELEQTVHPETIRHIRRNRRVVDERAVRSVSAFVLIFFGLLALGTLALQLDASRMDFDLNVFPAVADAAAALSNGGPGLGFAGPFGSFAPFSDVSKLILSALMLLGRLEVIPVAVLLTRGYWRA